MIEILKLESTERSWKYNNGNFCDKIDIVSLVHIILTDPTPTLKQASAASIVAPIMFF